MARAKNAAAARAAAAAAEVDGDAQPKRVEWRGLKLELPAELPLAVTFDLGDREDIEFGDSIRLVKLVVGREQSRAIRDKLVEDGLTSSDASVLFELFDEILRTYGFAAGESSASDGS